MGISQLPKVKITSNGSWSGTHVMIGDKELRVNNMTITISHYNTLRLVLEVEAPEVDIEVLERETELTIKKAQEAS